jgi:hypothetical protein
MKTRDALSLSLLLAAACQGDVAQHTPAATVSLTTPLRSPLTAKLEVKESSPGRAMLVAQVVRHVAFRADVGVRVTVPAGVAVTGPTEWVSPGTSEASVDARELEVRWTTLPPADLELVAQVQGLALGITASDAFRFGRPPPAAAPRVAAEGPHLVIGGLDVGASVPIQP